MSKRAIIIVMDSAGIGAMDDSYLYGDEGSNTIVNTAQAVGGLRLPHLQALGLGNLADIEGVPAVDKIKGAAGIMLEKSKGKDTTTGHWEMMGIILDHPFPTYPQGFPKELIREFEKRIGRQTLGNVVASGTEIIKDLGVQHMETGFPIVYTSADSVFQIAAHEEVVPLEELYRYCLIARELLQGEHNVGRVIARPFIGQTGAFVRTSNRHDFSLLPPENVIDLISASGQKVAGIGKIYDIFAGKSIDATQHIDSNRDGLEKTIQTIADEEFDGLLFVNLVDFDQQYGHRNDVQGYARALEEFDSYLSQVMAAMKSEDILFITADHGCDPTTSSTDHSREQVPMLVYGQQVKADVMLPVRSSFSDLGQTVAEYLGVKAEGLPGESFYSLIKEERA
ncbi:MAG: Phosphopentomutase [Firmicutes bacterium]|nr:Phosphopentomutase [Bacillota bacterium]